MVAGLDLPQPNDYLAAVQNPRNCFADPTLSSGQTLQTSLGLPKVASGNFAVVFQVLAGQARYAVKCFTRRSDGQQRRYAAIAKYLQERKLPYFVEFAYLQEGIRVRGAFFPIVKMEWAVGKLLHLFVEENLRRPTVLTDVAEQWRKVVADLGAAHLSHGDLQHRNVVVQGSKIYLIDYDDMYVPALRGEVGTEAGHEHFQHPQRSSADFGEWRDAFPSIVIYLSLRAIAADHSLWREFHLGENLILSKTDYQRSGQTRIWGRLAQSSDEVVRRLALQLQAYCRLPIRDVPSLESALAGKIPSPTAGPASPGSARAPKVDYAHLQRALGVGPNPAPAVNPRPQTSPAPPASNGQRRLAVDWEVLRRIEEAQRAMRAPRPAQRPPPAQAPGPSPTTKPTPLRKPPVVSTTRRRPVQQPATQQPVKPRRTVVPPPSASDGKDPAGEKDMWSRAISWLSRIFLSVTTIAMTALIVFLLGVYFAGPWIEANWPGLAGPLGPAIQTVRDWGDTVVPAPGPAVRGMPGLYPP